MNHFIAHHVLPYSLVPIGLEIVKDEILTGKTTRPTRAKTAYLKPGGPAHEAVTTALVRIRTAAEAGTTAYVKGICHSGVEAHKNRIKRRGTTAYLDIETSYAR